MSARSVDHVTFVVERTYDQPPDRVFAAWSSREAKARWWGSEVEQHELEFRVGGHELQRGIDHHGNAYTFQALYHDIIPSERIVYAYDMLLDATRISVSLATVELRPHGDGTDLRYTEQGAFLDGRETTDRRREGMGGLLDALGATLQSGDA